MYADRKSTIDGAGPRFRFYHIFKELRRIQEKQAIDSILEVGAGNGVNLALAHDLLGVGACFATDVIPRPPEMPDYVEYKQLEITGLEDWLGRSRMSVVLMIELLEHLIDPDSALEEVRSVLRPGGHVILTTPNLSSGINRLALLLGYQPLGTEVSTRRCFGNPGPNEVAGHLRVFTFRALQQFVRYYGFRVERAYTAPVGGGTHYNSVPESGEAAEKKRLETAVVLTDSIFGRLNRALASDSIFVLVKQ